MHPTPFCPLWRASETLAAFRITSEPTLCTVQDPTLPSPSHSVWLLNYWCLCIADFGLCVVPGECSSKADGGIYLTQKVGLYSSSCPHTARPSQWIWPQHCRTEMTFSHTQEHVFSFTTEIISRAEGYTSVYSSWASSVKKWPRSGP